MQDDFGKGMTMGDKAQYSSKIVAAADFLKMREGFRELGQKIVHCHGVFDLLHPGHIVHLEEAKALGDVLVVSVTADRFVNKGPGRPYFTSDLRMASLGALSCVDYVVLSEASTADLVISAIQPDLYVKGQEYAESNNDVTGKIDDEIAKVRSFGGDVHFTNGVVFSSTRLLNHEFPVFPPGVKEFVQDFTRRHSFADVRESIERFRQIKVLVVGDIIIDEYIFCIVQGLMSKARGLSARYEREERYLGGALAVARHISGFSDNVTVCGMVGNEPHIHSQLLSDMSSSMIIDLQFNEEYKTVVKRRFLERHGIREEYEKLFSINYLGDEVAEHKLDRSAFYSKLDNLLPRHDLIVVVDYGHGLINHEAMEILQDKAPFLAVNCQVNSSNYGTNLITKYQRADTFTLDQNEIRLAFADRISTDEYLLNKLMEHLKGQMGWLTQGSRGSLGISASRELYRNPALTLKVQDTVGAGDAFFALASMAACSGEPVEVGSFLGNIAGGLAANIVGNARPVTKVEVLKFATTLLNV